MNINANQRILMLKWTSYILALVAFICLLYTLPTILAELGLTSRTQSHEEEPIKIRSITATPGPKEPVKEQPTLFGGYYKNDLYTFAFLYPDIYRPVQINDNKMLLQIPEDNERRTITIEIASSNKWFQQIYDAHAGADVGDHVIKLSSGTIADAPTVEYLVNKNTLTRVIRKKDIYIEISATRNTKEELKDFKTVLDYITKKFNFYDEVYYTNTANWQTFKSDEVYFKYPINFTCVEHSPPLNNILEGNSSYTVSCDDILGNRIDIGIAKNTDNVTLDKALGTGPVAAYVDSYLKEATIYQTEVAGLNAIRADNMFDPRGGKKRSEVVLLKGEYKYQIIITGKETLMTIDNILNTLQVVKD